ncbi:Putative NAD dependent epimerase/dehydratase family protein [Aspergillus calidoustus]|uniref:Putative NAD dependent epimerase/dehydratase family protein n=1 Tax=Aspergillus calidoustus TaxID=454130 RepID=A0A0U5FTD2_ASPCI|nr:Putative NAD dependent epimerase/dehydratase family protein [Aspergillus calidoustus]
MQVLLLGGHGKVALHLTPLLLARAWDVTSVIRNPDHEPEILALAKGASAKGKLDVLISSLDDVKTEADAAKILADTDPDYVVWSAGAGGKGGPSRTIAIDEIAAKHFISAAYAHPRVTKFLLVSWLGSRRNRPSWFSDEDWAASRNVFTNVLPTYAKAKLEADEFLTAHAVVRAQKLAAGAKLLPLQAVCLRPGMLTDDPGTGKVSLGKTRGQGNVPREDVARVADALLARDDTHGWYDLLSGEEDIEKAVERVAKEGFDAVVGEDVEAMVKRFGLDS